MGTETEVMEKHLLAEYADGGFAPEGEASIAKMRLYLQAHQCYQYQGFLFSKPLEEEAFLDQLRQNTEIQSA